MKISKKHVFYLLISSVFGLLLTACAGQHSFEVTRNSDGTTTGRYIYTIPVESDSGSGGSGEGGGDGGGSGDGSGGGGDSGGSGCLGTQDECDPNGPGQNNPFSMGSYGINLLNDSQGESLVYKVTMNKPFYFNNSTGSVLVELRENGVLLATLNTTYFTNGNEIKPVDYPLISNWYEQHKNTEVEQDFSINFDGIEMNITAQQGDVVTETHVMYNANEPLETVARSYFYVDQNTGTGNDIQR